MKRLILPLALAATPVLAVQPDEMLSDPMFEAEAREISDGLRCPVCQNENIDDSNAVIAGELRILVRERLLVHYLEALEEVLAGTDIAANIQQGLNDAARPSTGVIINEAFVDDILVQIDAAGMDVDAIDAEAREVYLSGNPQQEVVDYIVSRYGEFVLLQPTAEGANLVLWIAPLVMLILALGVGIVTIRNKPAAKPDELSDEEKKRLEEILGS